MANSELRNDVCINPASCVRCVTPAADFNISKTVADSQFSPWTPNDKDPEQAQLVVAQVMIGDQLSDGWQASVSRSASHDTLGEGSPVERAAVDWEAYLQSIEPGGAPEAGAEPGPLPPPPRVSLLCSARRRLSDLLVVAPACYWLLGVALLHSAVGVSCGGLHLAALHVRPPSNPNAHVRKLAYT